MIGPKELEYFEQKLPRFSLDKNTGVVIAADSNVFLGVQVLITSLKRKCSILCYDLGLTELEKQWCSSQGITLKEVPPTPIAKNIECWQTYYKPWLLKDSPFDYTLWLDTDCVVIGNLEETNLIANQQTFFVKHWVQDRRLKHNSFELYSIFPTNANQTANINAGVIGIHKKDIKIIDDWITLLEHCFLKDLSMLELIGAWDEGGLRWSIEYNGAFHKITADYKYNAYTGVGKSEYQDISHSPNLILKPSNHPYILFKNLLELRPQAYILHFATCLNNSTKYWNLLKKQ